MSTAGNSPPPPPRPRVTITPMRPAPPTGRPRMVGLAVMAWVVAAVLLIATALAVFASLDDIRSVLAADLIREHPDSGTDARRAVDLTLVAGAVVAALVVVLGVAGSTMLWRQRRTGRSTLVAGALLAVAGAVGFHLTIGTSASALADAGLPTVLQWAPAAAAVLAVLATALTFSRAVTASLRR